jgi:hypothetical protein
MNVQAKARILAATPPTLTQLIKKPNSLFKLFGAGTKDVEISLDGEIVTIRGVAEMWAGGPDKFLQYNASEFNGIFTKLRKQSKNGLLEIVPIGTVGIFIYVYVKD